eukprot:TRINITY_DN15225_c0_g2_i1.p1 TRINITY_DN15225_c0_g2~~TRINITY_DN15225_c0_g2_i1.p1  ORF type:complete len:142 (+),score=22.77 TRINITY_DN15225_c0_g2_i1:218-643(+)
MWGVVFPWMFAFPLTYMPDVLGQVVNFSSLLFVAFTDFIVPFSLYVVLQDRQQERKSGLLGEDCATEDGNPAGVDPLQSLEKHHNAFPRCCSSLRESPYGKKVLSYVLGACLTGCAIAGTYLTIQQGSYELDQQTCANTGS